MNNYEPSEIITNPELLRVQAVYNRYVAARNELLEEIHLKDKSNRDPLSEYSEWLVATLVTGILAESRVQKGWDVLSPTGEKIQVKYLSNSTDFWVNEHPIQINALMDSYAIVIFEALAPQAVIIFPANNLEAIGKGMGKRHPNLETSLQFTRANYRDLRKNISKFKTLGVRLYVYEESNWVFL